MEAQLERVSRDICLKDEEIKDHKQTLLQFESILKKTTDRISAMVEKDQMRLETNVDFAVQVTIPVHDFSQQADFVTPRQGKSERKKKIGHEIKASLVQL